MNPSRTIPLVLVSLMILMEIYASRLRRSEAKTDDRGSLFALWLLIGGGYGVAFSLWRGGGPAGPVLGVWAVWTGAGLALAGMGLRVWSIATLGDYFTYVVKVTPEQTVVDTGPYRLLRHPSYTGALLTGIGIGLSLRLGLAPLIIGATSLAGYWIRMAVEERALAEGIGEAYRAYMGRTKRLIPYLW
jgi:protein-S-isoprenylcysteine O-methyltransferase Ste14